MTYIVRTARVEVSLCQQNPVTNGFANSTIDRQLLLQHLGAAIGTPRLCQQYWNIGGNRMVQFKFIPKG